MKSLMFIIKIVFLYNIIFIINIVIFLQNIEYAFYQNVILLLLLYFYYYYYYISINIYISSRVIKLNIIKLNKKC